MNPQELFEKSLRDALADQRNRAQDDYASAKATVVVLQAQLDAANKRIAELEAPEAQEPPA